MAEKRDKRKKDGARQSATTYMKILKKGKGSRVRHKRGVSDTARAVNHTSPELRGLSTAILNFDGRHVELECGYTYETGFLPPDDSEVCTRYRAHSIPHGKGSGAPLLVLVRGLERSK